MPFEPGKSGNPSGTKTHKRFMDALNRAIAQDDSKRLRDAAEQLLDKAALGEPWALGMLADRLDGKPAQAIIGEEENPLRVVQRIERVIVDNAKD